MGGVGGGGIAAVVVAVLVLVPRGCCVGVAWEVFGRWLGSAWVMVGCWMGAGRVLVGSAKRVLDEFIPVVDWLAPPWASRSSGPKLMAVAAPRMGPNRLRALGRRSEAAH